MELSDFKKEIEKKFNDSNLKDYKFIRIQTPLSSNYQMTDEAKSFAVKGS